MSKPCPPTHNMNIHIFPGMAYKVVQGNNFINLACSYFFPSRKYNETTSTE
uniref:Uncharacterized protein n=1 Tax=Arundo donax TaxID=35708 RepID=A0A0A9BRT1_ARUDO